MGTVHEYLAVVLIFYEFCELTLADMSNSGGTAPATHCVEFWNDAFIIATCHWNARDSSSQDAGITHDGENSWSFP